MGSVGATASAGGAVVVVVAGTAAAGAVAATLSVAVGVVAGALFFLKRPLSFDLRSFRAFGAV